MYKAVFGRAAKMPCGCEMAKEMGVNTWAAFAGTDDNALVDGDFVATEDELQTVLRSLRATLPTAPDGSILLVARAWAVRGTQR